MSDETPIEQLIENLRDPDWEVRYNAANRLKILGDARAVPALIGVLDDDNLTVRFIAAMTLGIIKDPQAVQPLINMLTNTTDHDVLWSAAWALSELGELSSEPLIDVLLTEDALTRDVAADVLGGLADARAIVPLARALEELGMADYPVTGRFGAADALERYGELAIANFVYLLHHDAPEIRARAASALGKIGKPESVPALIGMLSDNEVAFKSDKYKIPVNQVVAEALEKIGTREALEALKVWREGEL